MHEQAPSENRRSQRLYWLENVFWYHYKWYYFAAVFAAVLIVVSVVSFVSKVNYDWTVQYVHVGAADPSSSAELRRFFTDHATDTSGNGRVQVLVEEHAGSAAPGRRDMLGLLRDADSILFVLDGETLALYRALGYFDEAVPLSNGLWAAVHDAPFEPMPYEMFTDYGYTTEQVDESNAYLAEQHGLHVAEAKTILQNLR